MPKVSVIFPVGNREAFLAEAIESILLQSLHDLELIIVLDGVPEPVRAIVKRFDDERIRAIKLPIHLGVCAARNAAMAVARAPYMALMDSDDVALPQRLERQYVFMEAHPEVTVCGSNSVKQLKDGRQLSMRYPETDGMIKARLLVVDSAILNPTAMMRTEFVRRHAIRYDANLPRDHDHRFFVETMRFGATFYGLQEELLLYRRHSGNLTQDQNGVDAEKTRVREALWPLFFPELTALEARLLMRGMCRKLELTILEIFELVAVFNKALRESRVYFGEDRAEVQRIVAAARQRVLAVFEKRPTGTPVKPVSTV